MKPYSVDMVESTEDRRSLTGGHDSRLASGRLGHFLTSLSDEISQVAVVRCALLQMYVSFGTGCLQHRSTIQMFVPESGVTRNVGPEFVQPILRKAL